MTQLTENELTEFDVVFDDAIMCKPFSIECNEAAVVWWVGSCCGKQFPFCASHDAMAEEEHKRSLSWCNFCDTPTTQVTFIRIPIG